MIEQVMVPKIQYWKGSLLLLLQRTFWEAITSVRRLYLFEWYVEIQWGESRIGLMSVFFLFFFYDF